MTSSQQHWEFNVMLKRVRNRSALVDFARSRLGLSSTTSPAKDGRPQRRLIPIARTGLWQHADFLRFWAADAVSETGSQITILALPLLAAISLGATPAQMGLLTAAGTAPNLIFGLIAGVWVDRVRRRRLMMLVDALQMLLLLTIPVAWWLGWMRIEILYAVTFLAGTMKVFFDVSFMSYLPELIGRENLLEGNGKLQSTGSLAQVVGPGLAGVLVGVLGAASAVLLDAFSFLGSAIFLKRIHAIERDPIAPAEHPPVLRGIREGMRLALGHATLRALTLGAAMTSFFGYIFLAVYVLFMVNDLGLSASEVGLVFGLGGLGALIGSMLAAPIARRIGVGQTVIAGYFLFALFGAPVPLAVLMPRIALPMVLAAEFSQWLALVTAQVNAVSLRQAITPDSYLGRVNAINRFIVGGLIPIGSLIGGAMGEVIGLKATLVVATFGFLLSAVWVYFSPLRSMREQPQTLQIDEPDSVRQAISAN